MCQHGPNMGSKRLLAWISGGFSKGLGGILVDFRGVWGEFWKFWEDLGKDLIYGEELALNLDSSLHANVWLTVCIFPREKPYFC